MDVRYEQYVGEERDLEAMMTLVDQELSEPKVYTFRYFLETWPHLCFLAYPAQEDAGAISSLQQPIACVISKQESHKGKRSRGYIAMLSVERSWRRKGIARKLVEMTIEAMREQDAQEVILETEYDNLASLTLYGSLGFFREKRLHRFYLNGKDAYRLVLPLPSQDTDDEDSGAISDSQSEKSLARARLSSAADWVIANGEETVSTQDIERHSRAGGEYLSDKGHNTKREIASILEGINRTDIA
ncbi:hypothetical protein FFLO_02238 [Filobasidium floriforme]|uniref:N-acetyltransferase domain-containing protein n=1 Tax=Filobasidium floriforme TaxID=5210 RepID=A0A8K0JT83_9TREE|nr:hypothetical protein FFLO_02238 [Filobasidium floriforme]